MTLTELARKLRPLIEKAAISLDDADALEAKELYPQWSGDGVGYFANDRVRYEGTLYKVLQPHVSQESWTPIAAPSLFAKVLIPDPDVVPEWEQPDSTNPYQIGDRVMFNEQVYESTINNNIWSPESYPAGWKLIS